MEPFSHATVQTDKQSMTGRNKKLLVVAGAAMGIVVLGAFLWKRHFHRYTPVEAVLDIQAAIRAKDAPHRVERFLEVRYGPLSQPENRRKAFLDFFNIGHIEGLYTIVGSMPGDKRSTDIAAMAGWVEHYRNSMSVDERVALRDFFQSNEGKSQLRDATAAYLSKDVKFRANTAEVIRELMTTIATVQQP